MRVWFAGGGTGGHLYPGLAIARAARAIDPSVRPLFIGALRGIERDVLPGTEFEHRLLDLHPLYRSRPWANWRTVLGLSGALRALHGERRADRPVLIVGTGGYASGAALAYARLARLPFALQEQNSVPGATVRFFASSAREVYLGYAEAAARLRLDPARAIDTGNPIEEPPAVRVEHGAARARWDFPAGSPVVLIYGGSQGAAPINAAVASWLGEGAEGSTGSLHVIWMTGRREYDRYAHLEGPRVRVRPYLAPIAEAYAAADIAIARAGAMTTAELLAWGIPPILVPLPTAAADHQTANAVALEAAGAAVHLRQADLSASRISDALASLLGDGARLTRMREAARARARPHAARTIAARVVALARGDG